MEAYDFFLQLLIILLSARVLGEVVARFGVPSVIGELMAGVILGPSVLALIEPDTTIKLLAEIGILLLLFEVGLETDMGRMVKTGSAPVLVALAGFLVPFALGFSVSYFLFNQPLLVALFIGGTLTATSIGITVRVLTDLKRQHAHEAQIVLGAAVLDDVMGVILLALLYDFSSGGGISMSNTLQVILFILIFLFAAPLIAKLMAHVIRRFEKTSVTPGLVPASVVSLLLFFAWLAHKMGAPHLLGGFAAGMAISRFFRLPLGRWFETDEDFTHRVEHQMKPLVHLFTPIFFVTVGLSLNLRVVDWSSAFVWGLGGATLVIAFFGKIVAGWAAGKALHGPQRWAVGLAMIPRGEVGLIFAELGKSSGILDHNVYAAMLIVIALTTLLPPFILHWFYGKYGHKLS